MRCSRQLLPCRDENRRPSAADRRPGGCRSRRYSPSDVDFDAPAARHLGAHRRAARCETCSDTQERCKVRSSERAAGARGVANSYGECIASTRAYRIACSGRACSDQHCRRCSLSRGSYFAALFTPPIGRVALHYRLGMMQRTHGAHLRTVLRYCSRVIVSVSVRVMLGSIELCCRGSIGFSTVV